MRVEIEECIFSLGSGVDESDFKSFPWLVEREPFAAGNGQLQGSIPGATAW